MLGKLFGKKKTCLSLEDQFIRLKELGFDLNTGFSVKHLLEEFDRTEFDKDPYRLLQ